MKTATFLKEQFDAGLSYDEYFANIELRREMWDGIDSRATIPDDLVARAGNQNAERHLLVITMDNCGDAINILPYIARIVELNDSVDMRMVQREESPELMNSHLTDGSRSVPVVIILDADFNELAWWGPRPREIQQWVMEEGMKLEHRLSYMALIGTLSPMIGLFGTVHGMINSFQVIATSGSTPKASDLAVGISTALFTTLVGLAIAIPAIAAFNILKNRVARLVLEVGITSESLMSRFETVGDQK